MEASAKRRKELDKMKKKTFLTIKQRVALDNLITNKTLFEKIHAHQRRSKTMRKSVKNIEQTFLRFFTTPSDFKNNTIINRVESLMRGSITF